MTTLTEFTTTQIADAFADWLRDNIDLSANTLRLTRNQFLREIIGDLFVDAYGEYEDGHWPADWQQQWEATIRQLAAAKVTITVSLEANDDP